MSRLIKALAVQDCGTLSLVELLKDGETYGKYGNYVLDTSQKTELKGWGEMDGVAVALVNTEDTDKNVAFWVCAATAFEGSHFELVADITKARHFTSHEARYVVVDQLREQHGLQGELLYSYVIVNMLGRRMFVRECSK